ncbi:hypothetical protein SAY86_018181 [Trapa natans]|uniref:Uncharacterized protein n=1 Tax=Trapa natans TaxID=22666 RepID=A0AAN7R2W2_TRANT|nr:hypothetical protein SAY86_018181 [Trapa natans]
MEPHLLSLFLLFCLVSAALAAPLRSGRPRLADQFLRPHNAARTVLREPPLTWDPRLARTDFALIYSVSSADQQQEEARKGAVFKGNGCAVGCFKCWV